MISVFQLRDQEMVTKCTGLRMMTSDGHQVSKIKLVTNFVTSRSHIWVDPSNIITNFEFEIDLSHNCVKVRIHCFNFNSTRNQIVFVGNFTTSIGNHFNFFLYFWWQKFEINKTICCASIHKRFGNSISWSQKMSFELMWKSGSWWFTWILTVRTDLVGIKVWPTAAVSTGCAFCTCCAVWLLVRALIIAGWLCILSELKGWLALELAKFTCALYLCVFDDCWVVW